MIKTPMDVLQAFPIRKTKKQKQLFRDAVLEYVQMLDYRAVVENGAFGARNLVIGDPENARYLITAHYDTPAAMLVPNLITPTNPVTFVLYQAFLVVLLMLLPVIVSLLLGLAVLFGGAAWLSSVDGAELVAWAMVVWYFGFILLYFLSAAMLYFGPANRNNANDNTSGVVTVLEIARSLPRNLRHKVCFVLFDMEEKGLVGSWSYRRTHKNATDSQLVINLDCVGDGDHLRMFPTPKLKKDKKTLCSLYPVCGYFGKKSLLVNEKGFGYNPSDHKRFPNGLGIVALRKSRFGLYLSRIHTRKDTILDQTNVNILRAALISYISRNAVN